MENVTTWKHLENTIKIEKSELQSSDEKWKRQTIKLAKIFKKQFEDDKNLLKEKQTEYNYIINFVSLLFKLIFKDCKFLKLEWGETVLKASAILKNDTLRDDYQRSHGNKIDLILSIADISLEIAIMEVTGSPCDPDHTHFVGDRNKIAKMLKIIINYFIINYPGEFEALRKMKFYGIQIYNHTFYVYSMCMPFSATYYYKLEYKFSCPKTMRTLFRELPRFSYELFKIRELIHSSVSEIMTYIDIGDSEASDVSVDPVKMSPKKTRSKTRNSEM